jgi:hypothetical protein
MVLLPWGSHELTVVAADLALAGVQPGAHLDAERLHRVANCHGAADRSPRGHQTSLLVVDAPRGRFMT